MACPRCNSNDLWDDNLWWGCNSCGYAGNESGGTMIFAKDKPGLARTVKEVNERAGLGPLDYLPRVVPGSSQDINRAWEEEDNE